MTIIFQCMHCINNILKEWSFSKDSFRSKEWRLLSFHSETHHIMITEKKHWWLTVCSFCLCLKQIKHCFGSWTKSSGSGRNMLRSLKIHKIPAEINKWIKNKSSFLWIWAWFWWNLAHGLELKVAPTYVHYFLTKPFLYNLHFLKLNVSCLYSIITSHFYHV